MLHEPLASTSKHRRPRGRLVVTICVAALVLVAITVSVASLAFATTFTDVPASHPYYEAINDLASRGIIQGYKVGDAWEFHPGAGVYRAQFAKMICGTMDLTVVEDDWPDPLVPFTDLGSDVLPGPEVINSLYPHEYVAVAFLNGITNGQTPTTFSPFTGVKRAQVVSMIVRAMVNLHPGVLLVPPADYGLFAGVGAPHGENLRIAEYNGLFSGLVGFGQGWSATAEGTRGEVAQMLHNVLVKLTPVTTTTSSSTTTTTEVTTTTTSSTTTTTSSTTTTTIPATGYEDLGGELTSGPGVASWASGRLDVFALGENGHVWHKYHSGGWSTWSDHGGDPEPGSDPAAVSWGPNRIDLFIRGIDDHLWHLYWAPGWSTWSDHGGDLTSSPAAASWATNRLDIFARGANGHLWHLYWSPGWSAWSDHGGYLKVGSSPAAVSWGPNRIDIFTRGANDHLMHLYWNGGWSAWEDLGGTLTSSPAVCSWESGRLDVFARGSDDRLWHKWYESGSGWSVWHSEGGASIASAPDAVSWGPDRIDVFVRGTDDHLWHKWWDGSGWHP